MNNKNKLGLVVLLAGVAGNLLAGNLTSYATGDVLICFRNPGAGLNLVVDAGPLANFTGLAANQSYPITTYTPTQLAAIGINGTSWSAFTWQANNTLYVTRARATNALNVQTAPWLDKTSLNQQYSALRMATIPTGAAVNYGAGYNDGNSTATAVVEEDISAGNGNYPTGSSYHDALFGSYGGNFNGTFQGNPESTTKANFTTSGKVLRSDFYQLTPTAGYGEAVLLGYFELNTNGAMTYVAYPSATPVVNTLSRSGNVTTIDYNTGLYGTYTLRGTNSAGLGAARTNWPAIATLVNDAATDHTVTDTTTDNNRFYIITAQ
jgi:hypothetical protein